MDTQGSELQVLRGASVLLKCVRFIKTEAADFESYRGCTTVDELTDFLKARGFKLTHREAFAEHKNGGEIL